MNDKCQNKMIFLHNKTEINYKLHCNRRRRPHKCFRTLLSLGDVFKKKNICIKHTYAITSMSSQLIICSFFLFVSQFNL